MKLRTCLIHFILSLICVLSVRAQQFEQVLIPFTTGALTGNGGTWRTELWIRNDTNASVNLFPEKCFHISTEISCIDRLDVPASTTMLANVFPNFAAPGILLYVPVAKSKDIHFNLRVRNASLSPSGLGVDVPVVREQDLFLTQASIINVPVDSTSRITLRVYSPDRESKFYNVRIFSEPDGALITERQFFEILPLDLPYPAFFPVTLNLSSAFAGVPPAPPRRVRVVIEQPYPAGQRFWPLLSVTDNATQAVTLIRP